VSVAAGVSWPVLDRARTSGWWGVRTVARSSRRRVVARATPVADMGNRGWQ